MRAFRPGRLMSVDDNEYDAEWEEAKQLNIQRYSERARAGLPLFETMQIAREVSDTPGFAM